MHEILELEGEFTSAAEGRRATSPARVLKHGDTFAVFDHHGDVVAAEGGEHGLYHHGTRFLLIFEVLLAGRRPLLLSSTVSDDNLLFAADLTNVDVRRDNRLVLPHGEVHLFRSRILGDGYSIDVIRVCNHSMQPIEMPLLVRFDADFADVFEVRGTRRQRRGTRLPDRPGDEYVLGYLGLDNVERRTRIRWSRRPDAIDTGRAMFRFTLDPRATTSLELSVTCEDDEHSTVAPEFEKTLSVARRRFSERTERTCTARSSNESLNRWLKRSSADLEMMITDTPHGMYPYAGIPWFSTPFGRDGLITAFELLWVDPAIARGVLSFLAATQATVRSDAQDAEPGKILHEMRQGEMPALGEVPFGRYYGSIDSTPLFIALAAAYYRRTADREFIDRLWPNLLAALTWMERDGDCDRDGFLEYARHSANGLVQQG